MTAAFILLAACGRTPESGPANNEAGANEVAAASQSPGNAAAPEPLPLHERDAAGAVRVVTRAIASAKSGRFDDVRQLWRGGADEDRLLGEIERAAKDHPDVQAVVAGPGAAEGAAGSTYMTIPVALTYVAPDGAAVHRTGTATLRRANDVPGASEEQLSWRIVGARLDPPSR